MSLIVGVVVSILGVLSAVKLSQVQAEAPRRAPAPVPVRVDEPYVRRKAR